MKICTFEPFPAYGKMGVNQKIFSRHKLLLKDQNCVLYIVSFKNQFNPRE